MREQIQKKTFILLFHYVTKRATFMKRPLHWETLEKEKK